MTTQESSVVKIETQDNQEEALDFLRANIAIMNEMLIELNNADPRDL